MQRSKYSLIQSLGQIACLAAWLLAPSMAAAQAVQKVDFNRQIRPILAKHCYQCHGPNEDKGGLRLSKLEAALAELESGAHAIVPGQVDQSALVKRIKSEDLDERMPPEGKPLSAEQIQLLESWIAQGAKWEQHWAFEPVKRVAAPPVKNAAWVRTPIDAFILNQLEAAGLEPPPAADKIALIRRATYDLTGLPPTRQEVAAFLADSTPSAYEKLVDRLLTSPHYGEHWGRHWLDVVRYAETNSFERDGRKPHAFRYRDYVIRAFNDDKPYDEFVRDQIAGDELPKVTNESIIATGYYRLGLWDDEPADRLLARYDELDDIVATTSQAFLALTVNCARCHDHKIDPIPQRDYYQLLAFFQNIRSMQTNGPNVETPIFSSSGGEAGYRAELAALEKEKNDVQDQLSQLEAAVIARYREKQSAATDVLSRTDIDALQYRFYRDTWQKLPDFANLKPESTGELPDGLFDLSPSTRNSAFGFVFQGELIVPETGDYTFYLDSDDGSRLRVNDRVVLEYDGIHGEGQEKRATVNLAKGRVPIALEYFQAESGWGLSVGWSGPGLGVSRKSLSKLAKDAPVVNVAAIIETQGSKLVTADEVARYKHLRKTLEDLKSRKIGSEMALSVTENGPQAPETTILSRGNPHVPGDRVEPGFPEILTDAKAEIPSPPRGAKTSGRRKVLADWLASKDNKLTSRVMVNRIWQHHFGRGIVRSPNNFGGLGIPPTHPELLDYLASQYMDGGWRMKPLHRQIMLSSAYQMSSRPSADALRVDPANNLFSRFEIRRLGAEEVRDSILAVNGRLNAKLYGPSFYPEISAEVKAGQSIPGNGWDKSSPEEQCRRSVYIHVKRSLITPILSNFDFPDPDSSCEARFATTQPTQALGMINGQFLQEEAAAFAARLKKEAGEKPVARIKLALELALSRKPHAAEIERGLKLIASLQSEHRLGVDAAWQYYCLSVLNLNEFVYLD